MKSFIFIFIALFSLGISASNNPSLPSCYCHATLVGLNKLWKQFGCNKLSDQAPRRTVFTPIESLEDSEMTVYGRVYGKLPDYKDGNCNYLYRLFKFDNTMEVGMNWEGKVGKQDQYQGGGALNWNVNNQVKYWRKKDEPGSKNGVQTCKCFARATLGCKKNDKSSGCWWDNHPIE